MMSSATNLSSIAKFSLHTLVALMGSMGLAWLLFMLFSPWLGTAKNPWTDFPYSPFLWGSAFFLGLLINMATRNRSAKWVWLVGLLWLIAFTTSNVKGYDPRWCLGCSVQQYVWYSLFSYWNCSQECLGQLLVTTPMLNSIAYSIGATLALSLKDSIAGPATTQDNT